MNTEKATRYNWLAAQIKEYIASHGLTVGDKLPTVQEWCGLYDVSHATVRAALNLLGQEGVVESRPRQGVFVAPAKAGSATQVTERVIALLISGEESPFEAGIIRGVMEQSLAQGHQVIVAGNGSDVNLERQQMEDLSSQVRGLIVLPTHASGNYLSYANLLERGIPWVFIDRGVSGLAAPLVATDNELGGYLAVRHLLDIGIREIYAISGKAVVSIQERIQGVRRAFKEAGLPQNSTNIRSAPEYVSSYGYSLTQDILRQRQGKGRLGIFVMDETLALPCYAALKEAGMRIPEDVAVISYDDISAQFFDPPLSSVRQDPHTMGKEATRMLLNLLQSSGTSSREVRLPPRLIVRNSTDLSCMVRWSDYRHGISLDTRNVPSPIERPRVTTGSFVSTGK